MALKLVFIFVLLTIACGLKVKLENKYAKKGRLVISGLPRKIPKALMHDEIEDGMREIEGDDFVLFKPVNYGMKIYEKEYGQWQKLKYIRSYQLDKKGEFLFVFEEADWKYGAAKVDPEYIEAVSWSKSQINEFIKTCRFGILDQTNVRRLGLVGGLSLAGKTETKQVMSKDIERGVARTFCTFDVGKMTPRGIKPPVCPQGGLGDPLSYAFINQPHYSISLDSDHIFRCDQYKNKEFVSWYCLGDIDYECPQEIKTDSGLEPFVAKDYKFYWRYVPNVKVESIEYSIKDWTGTKCIYTKECMTTKKIKAQAKIDAQEDERYMRKLKQVRAEKEKMIRANTKEDVQERVDVESLAKAVDYDDKQLIGYLKGFANGYLDGTKRHKSKLIK